MKKILLMLIAGSVFASCGCPDKDVKKTTKVKLLDEKGNHVHTLDQTHYWHIKGDTVISCNGGKHEVYKGYVSGRYIVEKDSLFLFY